MNILKLKYFLLIITQIKIKISKIVSELDDIILTLG